jgi:hypothetical protein
MTRKVAQSEDRVFNIEKRDLQCRSEFIPQIGSCCSNGGEDIVSRIYTTVSTVSTVRTVSTVSTVIENEGG